MYPPFVPFSLLIRLSLILRVYPHISIHSFYDRWLVNAFCRHFIHSWVTGPPGPTPSPLAFPRIIGYSMTTLRSPLFTEVKLALLMPLLHSTWLWGALLSSDCFSRCRLRRDVRDSDQRLDRIGVSWSSFGFLLHLEGGFTLQHRQIE